MNVRFIADLHLGHENMAKHRGFKDAEEHDNFLIESWNSVVHKRDATYILGDVSFNKKFPYPKLSRLNGIIHGIGGNHDRRQDVQELLKYVDSFTGCMMYREMWLTHIPVHPMELKHRAKVNIHGHIHEKSVRTLWGTKDKRYVCVSCEQVDYKPKTLKELGL